MERHALESFVAHFRVQRVGALLIDPCSSRTTRPRVAAGASGARPERGARYSAPMSSLALDDYPLEKLANQVGTPFYLTDGGEVRRRLARLQALTDGPGCRRATP